MMRSPARPLHVGLAAVLLMTSGCFGPFNLTRRVYHWNAQSSDRWEREFLFLLLTWAPVYGFAGVADAVLFNAIEFWGGHNPVSPPAVNGSHATPTRRISRGPAEVVLTREEEADAHVMTADLYVHGAPAGSARFERRDGEPIVAKDGQGRAVFSATTLSDGSIAVSDDRGRRVAVYASDEVERVLRPSPGTQRSWVGDGSAESREANGRTR